MWCSYTEFGFYFIIFTQLTDVSANERWDRRAISYGKGKNMSSQFPPEDSGVYKDPVTNEWRVFLPTELDSDFPPPIKKPTLGIMPRRVWLHQRAIALTEAIGRYTEAAVYANAYDLIDELDEILEELKIPQVKND